MIFTDDDLKRLTENIRLAFGDGSTMRHLEALLARLEAAERVCAAYNTVDPFDPEIYHAWLASKGTPAHE